MKPIKRANINLFEHDPEEKILGEARRHPIGIVFIIISALIIIFLINLFTYFVIENEGTLLNTIGLDDGPNLSGGLGLIIAAVSVLVVLGTAMAVYVYNRNYIVLTDQKIVLVNSYSFIRRKVSQLSIGDVQDLSVLQNSLLSRIFKYGSIFIETAGEQRNISMNFIEQPFEVSKAIVDAHEVNLKLYGN